MFDAVLNEVTLPVAEISIQDAYSTVSSIWGTYGTPSVSNRKQKRATSGSTSFSFNTNAFETFYADSQSNILSDLGLSNQIIAVSYWYQFD